jgi:uncharacterized RDD family membrane protein YckC
MDNTEQSPGDEMMPEPASFAKRVANYFIDLIFFSFIASFFIVFLFPAADFNNNPKNISLQNQLMILFAYGLFMSFTEALFRGKTLGKLITRTRAVNKDGGFISPQTAFVRGLCRIVPFDQFSAIGIPPHPWHDKWSHTYVVDEKHPRPSKT